MAVYVQKGEIEASLRRLVSKYVQECIRTKKIPQELAELIRHNFLAKYVYFDKRTMTVEIGIIESEERRDCYPKMRIYSFPIETAKEWLSSSYQTGVADLEFYGRLLNSDVHKTTEEVVIL